jgi:hypothetical protein
VPGGCTTAGDGSTDDSACIQTAVYDGDVQVNGGNYALNTIVDPGNYGRDIDVPAGRNIRCGTGTNPSYPAPLNGSAGIFSWGASVAAQYRSFLMEGGGSIMGCQFRGPRYGAPGSTMNNKNQGFIGIVNPGGAQVLIANDDFNGSEGYLADVDIAQNGTGTLITYNTAENCGYYYVQSSNTNGATISYSTIKDCSCCVEQGGGPGAPDYNVHIDHITSTFQYGTGVAVFDGAQTSGQNFLSAGNDSSGGVFNYSSNTLSNSSCSGTMMDGTYYAGLDEYVAGGNAANCPTYINNKYTGSCQLMTSCPGGP